MSEFSDYLAHHGVKGMKWGVRNEETRNKYSSEKGNVKTTKADKKLAKQQKRFVSEVNNNWIQSYNKAADKQNKTITDVNRKYKKYDFSRIIPGGDNSHVDSATKKAWNNYVTELGTSWSKHYSDQLLSDFGEAPGIGKKWVENAPFMDSYSGLKIK